jgi:hypothetical protein
MLRWLGPLGVGFLASIVLGFIVLSRDTPDQNAPATQVVQFYRDHGTRETAAVWVVGIGLALLTFYICALRVALRQANPEHSWLATGAFAGGLILVTGFAVTGINHYALVLAAHNNRVSLAGDLNFIDGVIPLPVMLGLGVMSLSVGAAILAGSVLPKWLGVVGVVMAALTAAGPIGFIALVALPVYFTILGFVIPAKLMPHEHTGPEDTGPEHTGPEAGRHRMRHLVPRSHH